MHATEIEYAWTLVFACGGVFSSSEVTRSMCVCRSLRLASTHAVLKLDLSSGFDSHLFRRWIASDPTPRRVLALKGVNGQTLMCHASARDGRKPSFLGRLGYGPDYKPDGRARVDDGLYVERIWFGPFFDAPIRFLGAVDGLVEIRLGNGFESAIDTWQLPRTLRVLHTGRAFNRTFAAHGLPDTLRVLKFGACFAEHVDSWGLPRGLLVLRFGFHHQRPIDTAGLPPALRELRVGHAHPCAVDARALPPSLRRLRVPACQARRMDTRGARYDLVLHPCTCGDARHRFVATVSLATLFVFVLALVDNCGAFGQLLVITSGVLACSVLSASRTVVGPP